MKIEEVLAFSYWQMIKHNSFDGISQNCLYWRHWYAGDLEHVKSYSDEMRKVLDRFATSNHTNTLIR